MGDTDLDPIEFKSAIGATFIRQKMARLAKVPVGLSDDFSAHIGKQIQWRAFLKKNQLKPVEPKEVVPMLQNNFQKIGVIWSFGILQMRFTHQPIPGTNQGKFAGFLGKHRGL